MYSGSAWVKGAEAGLITFANAATFNVAPTDQFAVVHSGIDAMTPSANSNIASAIEEAHDRFTNFATGDQDKIIVLLSDGEPTHPGGRKNAENAAKAAADAAKADGIIIYTVALQQGTKGRELLLYLASGPQYYLEDQSNEILTEIYESMFGSIHCGCKPFEEIDIRCGNGVVDIYSGSLSIHNEECDEGMYCDD